MEIILLHPGVKDVIKTQDKKGNKAKLIATSAV
jgi:hypothetical protein